MRNSISRRIVVNWRKYLCNTKQFLFKSKKTLSLETYQLTTKKYLQIMFKRKKLKKIDNMYTDTSKIEKKRNIHKTSVLVTKS